LNKIESRYRNQLYAHHPASYEEEKSQHTLPGGAAEDLMKTALSGAAMGELDSEDSISSHEPPLSSSRMALSASHRVRAVKRNQLPFVADEEGHVCTSSSSSQSSKNEDQRSADVEETYGRAFERAHRWFRTREE
jgi:hypothetical protein